MNVSKCPICGQVIKLKNKPRLGQTYTCSECESLLEVVTLQPLEFDVCAFEEDEPEYHYRSNNHQGEKNTVVCPLCLEKIPLNKRVWIGDRITCPACRTEHQVIGVNPIELDWPYNNLGLDYASDDHEEYTEYEEG